MRNIEKSSKTLDDDEILDGAVFTVKQTRILKVIVIVMGLMLIFGFIALAIAVMNKASKRTATAKKAAISAALQPPQSSSPSQLIDNTALKLDITPDLPQGAKLLSYKISGTTMILHMKRKNSNQIILLDLASGKIKSRIHLPQ